MALDESTLARCSRPAGSSARQSVKVPPVSTKRRQRSAPGDPGPSSPAADMARILTRPGGPSAMGRRETIPEERKEEGCGRMTGPAARQAPCSVRARLRALLGLRDAGRLVVAHAAVVALDAEQVARRRGARRRRRED